MIGPIRITHPFHPRCGEVIDFVVHRAQWGEERVFYRDRDGHLASLPARWTSLGPDDPLAAVGGDRPRFRVDDLIALVALVARCRS